MNLRAQLLYEPEPEHMERLRGLLSGVKLSVGSELADGVEVLVAGRPDPALLDGPSLHTLVIPWSGLPPRTRTALRERPHLRCFNLHHNAGVVAEMAVALVLAAAKLLVPMDRALRRGDWRARYEPDRALALAGRTAVVLGYGAIGRRVGRALEALGLTVVGVRRRDGVDLDDVLRRAQVLVIALPHTEETDGLIDADRLSFLPRDAVLVNVARARIVDEDALFDALRDGRLAGAGLDVWYRYPKDEASRTSTKPGNRPFHELDNVVLSPHRAGHVRNTEMLRMEALAAVLNILALGQEPPTKVDVARGY